MKKEWQVFETLGESKARKLRRLCRIMDHKGEKYDPNQLMKLTREKIDDMINEKIDEPYQRFDS